MELDKRIVEGKRPLTCFDIDEAKQYIGKECYFSNYLCNFNDINSIAPRALLHSITEDKDASNPYYSCPGYFAYCLPCEWVKEEEPKKKYRAYTLAEWIDQHEIGDVVKFRNSKGQEFHVLYTGYTFNTNDDIQDTRTKGQIMFMSVPYSFQELFANYEICVYGEWQPFGIEVKENE